MPHGSRLSLEEQAQVDILRRNGYTCRGIAAEIGRSANCIHNYLKNPNSYRKKKNPGRPRVLSEATSRHLCRILSNSTVSLGEVKADLGLSASRTTIWRTIVMPKQITRQVMKPAPRLKQAHKCARLRFVQKNFTRDSDKVSHDLPKELITFP
ncbi:hypothetical protein ANCCAN_10047 [Ancylostoma caninum]|uniref:Uncharacterized protein n=1 Tax=Ancylostoma caninum TaxID=29170 RepID=A0A368GHV1_ANCCA|nr:hypothetical protein ANCCAN_10047 [Ancylostoma caninum]